MAGFERIDPQRYRDVVEKARLARAARADLQALKDEGLTGFSSPEALFAAIDERVRQKQAKGLVGASQSGRKVLVPA